MNKTQLIGRVTKDLELVQTANSAYCKFTVAVNRRKKDDGADFISCTAWGKTSEVMSKYVHKGDRVGLVGHIQTGNYEKDGRKYYTTDVIVDELEFLENKKQGDGASVPQNDGDFMTIPEGAESDLPF